MNAIARPPTPETIAAAEQEHAQLARNRQGTPPTVRLVPAIPVMETPAFRLSALRRRVQVTESALERRRAERDNAVGRVARDKATRAFRTASQAAAKAKQALTDEERGEHAAPAVQRDTIMDGDVTLREARVDVPRGARAVLVAPIDRLLARKSISRQQHAAAKRYRDAWEMAGRDAYPVGYGGDGGRSAPGSGNRRIEEPLGAHEALTALRLRLTPKLVGLVEHVVVEERDVSAWAVRSGVRAEAAMGMFIAALEVVS